MRLSALQIARWVHETRTEIEGSSVGTLVKDEVRKQVSIDLVGNKDKRLSYLFLPGESLLFLDDPSRWNSRKSAKTTNFLPQLTDSVIYAVEQLNFDRIIRFSLRRDERQFFLVFELFGPGSNVYLLNAESAVITTLRRSTQPEIYSPPNPPAGIPPGAIDLNTILEMAAARPTERARNFFREQIRGCDKSFWEIALSAVNDQTCLGDMSRTEIERAVEQIRECYQECVQGILPVALDGGTMVWITQKDQTRETSGLNDKIAEVAVTLSRQSAERSIRQRIAQGIKSQRKRLEGKLDKLNKIILEAADASRYREWAELLTINIGKIRRGMSSITVVNLYDESLPEITIPLPTELAPSANIKRLFKRYRKLTDGVKESEKQIAQIRIDLEKLGNHRDDLDDAKNLGDLLKLEKALVKDGILKRREARISSHRAEPAAAFYPRTYNTPAGEQVLVGRNGKENEFVSFVAAKKHDFWFHSQQTPGSHVILKLKDKNSEPSYESILMAARIAAYYSQARTSEKVPIIYTEVKYLQKIKGGLPGKVRYTRVKSIMVEPGLPK